MCVGFLYTVVTKVLLALEVTKVFRKGKDPSGIGSSVVNCMCWILCIDVVPEHKSISQHVNAGQLNVPTQQQQITLNLTRVTLN